MEDSEKDALVLASDNERLDKSLAAMTAERDSLKKQLDEATGKLKVAEDSQKARDLAEADSLRKQLAGDAYKEEELKAMSLHDLQVAADAFNRVVPKAGQEVPTAVRSMGSAHQGKDSFLTAGSPYHPATREAWTPWKPKN